MVALSAMGRDVEMMRTCIGGLDGVDPRPRTAA
jgi:hypothetical protein